MGLDTGAKRAQPDFRSEVAGQLNVLAESGRKIAEMAATVGLRLFGPHPTAERTQPGTCPIGTEAPLETVFSEGYQLIKAAQNDTGGELQEILSRL